MAYIEMFPEVFIDLQREILDHHSDLQEKLNSQPNKDTAVLFAEIATHLNIILAGDYMLPDLAKLFLSKLQEKRRGGILIVSEISQLKH